MSRKSTLPDPAPGLVIRYSYLWHREFRAGIEEGTKDRPCTIVTALRMSEDGAIRIVVLPVTHSSPADPASAIEIPFLTKVRLGLDSERSWVVLSEWNEFIWPGPDLRRVPGSGNDTVAYGFLPPKLFVEIRERFLALVQSRRARRVERGE